MGLGVFIGFFIYIQSLLLISLLVPGCWSCRFVKKVLKVLQKSHVICWLGWDRSTIFFIMIFTKIDAENAILFMLLYEIIP